MKRIRRALLAAMTIMAAVACNKPQPDPTPINPDPDPDPIPDPVPEVYSGIKTAADLQAFADSVNAGRSVARFCNAGGEVVLLSDVDMAGVTSWTPIGMPATVENGNSASAYTGPAFKGVFNGQEHAIFNFNVSTSLPAGSVWGLFGLIDGGTVKNLQLGKAGDDSSVTVSAAGTADAGILAGAVIGGAVIDHCTNNIPFNVAGTTASARFSCGTIAGYVCSTDKAASLTALKNTAAITMDSGSNTANGATGVIVGGIAGFCTGTTDGVLTTIENCENTGSLSGKAGRSAGMAGAMNARTFMRYCTNRGHNVNSFANARVANLTVIMGNGSMMDDCTNYGDCVTSDAQSTTAGMVALLNHASVVVTGGGNYGRVISANQTYHGLLVANFSAFSSVKGCYAGGSCGTYSADGNHSMHELTAENWLSHIGKYSDLSKITEISSPYGSGGGSTTTGGIPEFKDASLKVLFIGNSFTKDAVEHLPGIIKAAGMSDRVTLAHCYYGGRTIPEYYSDREVANNTLYYMNAGESKWTTHGEKASIKDVAGSGRWDVVTIQEHTGNYRAWSWTDTEKKAIQDLVDYVCGTQGARPKVYYIMSQAYYDMSKIGSGSKPYITWNSQAEMFNVIVEQTRKVIAETSVDDVIATGTMLQNLRSSKLDNDLNLTRDGYHMDYGISRYGAACTVFEKALTPVLGVKLDGNSFRYSGSEAGTTAVTNANAPVALQAARYAIEKPFELTSMEEQGGNDNPGTGGTLKGSGTEADPYLIDKADDMSLIGSHLVEKETRHFKMTADIDMSSISDWTPVNTANKAMNMVFDGQNHVIRGFTCTNKTYASLFGLISGTVKNLRMENPEVTNNAQLGVLATWLGNSTGALTATVENVHITGAKLTKTGTAAAPVGGIAANAGASTIRACSVHGTITSEASGGAWNYVGGIAGRIYVSGNIERCGFEGNITSKGGYGFAGIAGGSAADVAINIKNCYSTGSITGPSYSGGIVGDLCKGSAVSNCYSTMSMKGVYNFGSIVARASNAKNPYTAGTFSTDIKISVTGCIAWCPSMTTTSSTETPDTHYSSGAVVGFTTYVNVLNSCYRRPDMTFKMYKSNLEEHNTLTDTPDVSPSTPLEKPSNLTFHCPYNGKTASASESISSLAKALGWSSDVWDFSSEQPKLR